MTLGSRFHHTARRVVAVTATAGAFCLITTSPALGFAQTGTSPDLEAENRTLARELALQGASSFDSGDFTTALDRFSRAHSLFPAPTLSIMLARSLVRLNRYIEALDRYQETLRTPLTSDAPEAFQQAVVDARKEHEALRQRTPKVVIRIVTNGALPSDLEVLLDGKPVPPALLNVPRPIDPGEHEVRVSTPRQAEIVRRLTTEVGTEQLLVIPLAPGERAAAPPPNRHEETPVLAPATSSDSDAAEPPSPSSTLAYLAFGVGAAGTGLGVVTGLIALDKKSELDRVCSPGCPPERSDDIDSFRSNRTLSYVGFGVGLVGVGLGTYLVLAGPPERPRVGLALGPTQAQLVGVLP